jgi:hypothetical protein
MKLVAGTSARGLLAWLWRAALPAIVALGPLRSSANAGSEANISPADRVLDVTIVDGTITTNLATFSASADGTTVAGNGSLDRGDLGAIHSTGTFTASGGLSGSATARAVFGPHLELNAGDMNGYWSWSPADRMEARARREISAATDSAATRRAEGSSCA